MQKSLKAVALLFVAVICLAACGETEPELPSPPTPEEPSAPALSGGYEGTDGEIAFKLPDLGENVVLHTQLQTAYLTNEKYEEIKKYADGVNKTDEEDHRELSHPQEVVFSWEAAGAAADAEYVLRVGEGEEMQNVWEFTTSETSFSVSNLKIATTYYWNISVGNVESGKAWFTTEGLGPRNLYVDGVANVRDLGGWQTESGVRVKQGLMYRCGRLNKNYSGEITVTNAGIDMLRNRLNIRAEIDLRGGSNDPSEYGNIEKSMLGDDIFYYHTGMNWEGSLIDLNRVKIRAVFALLADENNYPLIFHCSIGTDRTGVIAFLVGALLGVSEEDLYRDYLFSNFAYIEGARDLGTIRNTYVADIKGAAGSTLAEKTRTILLERLRVPEEQLQSIVRIMLG